MKKAGKSSFLILWLSGLMLATGCFPLGPRYEQPDLGLDLPQTYRNATAEHDGPADFGPWWKTFGNDELNRLVDDVLKYNWDIKKAAARLLEVRSLLVQTRADRFPSLNLKAEARSQRQTFETTVPSLRGKTMGMETIQQRKTIDTHAMSLPATFELDLWGRLARAEEAVKAEILQAEETRHMVAQSMIAEAVSLYLQMQAIERRIMITRKTIENYSESLQLVENRYERGLRSILDVRQARRLLAQAESALPELINDLGKNHHNLSLLSGKYPQSKSPETHPETYFKYPDAVPCGLPSELLLRRPDIRSAEARLKALYARVGVAKASRFPRITLTGTFGYSSDELDKLFKPESELWQIASGLVQPLFDAGKLKANQRAAEARLQQGLADYAKTVLTAFAEVEDALLSRKQQTERRKKIESFLLEARATQEIAESRYDRGLVDFLNVLEARQTRFNAEESLVRVDLALLMNRVTLHRALGGGWGKPEVLSAGPENERKG